MPYYPAIRRYANAERIRTIESLQRLRDKLVRDIPPRDLEGTLLLATWNIRDFDSNKFRHGPRLTESYHYIAEIISHFDIIAVQEVNDDLAPLEKVMNFLGPWWDYITTDLTAGRGGNNERGTIIFDKRKVRFDKIAGEVVLPRNMLIDGEEQFARTPYLVSFKAGWFSFSLCTVHLYYGDDSGEKLERRIEEIEKISGFLAERAKMDNSNLILLGDFNIVSPEHKTMEALLRSGFYIPDNLRHATNAMKDKYYDQIAFWVKEEELKLASYHNYQSSGIFDLYNVIMRPKDWQVYYDAVKDDPLRDRNKWDIDSKGKTTSNNQKEKYFKDKWRTFQISDHLPLWVALKIDFSDRYLKSLL